MLKHLNSDREANKNKLTKIKKVIQMPMPELKAPKQNVPKRVQYSCSSCNYKFSRNEDYGQVKVCPYCSKATVSMVTNNYL